LVIRDAGLAKRYRANWESRQEVSAPYAGPIEDGVGLQEKLRAATAVMSEAILSAAPTAGHPTYRGGLTQFAGQ
jgi:hypothetical protein